MIWPSWFR